MLAKSKPFWLRILLTIVPLVSDKEKSNNEGIYLGKVFKFNKNKGHISLELENSLSVGDKIRVENLNDIYVNEIFITNKTIKKIKIFFKTLLRLSEFIFASFKLVSTADELIFQNPKIVSKKLAIVWSCVGKNADNISLIMLTTAPIKIAPII